MKKTLWATWLALLLAASACTDDAHSNHDANADDELLHHSANCDAPDVLLYTSPGCGADVVRSCVTGMAGACASVACSCSGEVIHGPCNGLKMKYQENKGAANYEQDPSACKPPPASEP